MNYSEFENKVLNKDSKRKFKVSNSWGVYDAYKHIRKNHWYDIKGPIKEKDFYAIIRGVNKKLADAVIKGDTISFPYNMGKLELRKNKHGVSIVDGILKNTYPVNWKETIRLWIEDNEEKQKKTLVRYESKYVYRVKYNKFSANYSNKNFYSFVLNRDIKIALKDKINKGEIDALW